MKNTLWTFGCSFTAEWHPLDNDPPNNYDLYKKWRGGNLPPVWPTVLAEKLGMNLQNKGQGATGNDDIFIKFCNSSHLFNQGDVVIVGWTQILRYLLAIEDEGGKLVNILPNMEYPQFDYKVLNYITVNRDNHAWYNQLVGYIKLIINYCNSIGVSVYFWTSDTTTYPSVKKHINPKKSFHFIDWDYGEIFETLRSTYYPNNQQDFKIQIKHETNGEVPDAHLNEKGHRMQADLIYNHIIKNEKNI